MTFAELFRNQVFTINIPMCEDPQEGTPINVPHMKGDWAEQMMIDVYRRYCGPQGYMGLEQLTEFLNDAAIVSSHLPRSDDDEPDEVLQRILVRKQSKSTLRWQYAPCLSTLLDASWYRRNLSP